MVKVTIERMYRVPVYQHLMVEADTVEEACRIALDTEPEAESWDSAKADYDASGPVFICLTASGAWAGETAYPDNPSLTLPIPPAFSEDGVES